MFSNSENKIFRNIVILKPLYHGIVLLILELMNYIVKHLKFIF